MVDLIPRKPLQRVRKQLTHLSNNDESESEFHMVSEGVPHGSILVSLLFLIFSNNLPKVISSAKVVF